LFAALRRAVVAEGASDFVLLPTLLREATGENSLGYQVVPGLGGAGADALKDLRMEAARVAYVVDADDGGEALARQLRAVGVADERILRLDPDVADAVTLEDVIAVDAYVAGVNAEFERSGRELRINAREVPAVRRAAWLEAHCANAGVAVPHKRAVAYQVAQQRGILPLLSERGRELLTQLRERLGELLAVEPDPSPGFKAE